MHATGVVACVLPNMAAAATANEPLIYSDPAWSPYLVGVLIAVLSGLTFYVSNKALGASGAYATFVGLLGSMVARKHFRALHYYKENPPKLDWGVMLAVGMLFGAFVAAWTGDELTSEWLPSMWVERFGADSLGLRGFVAFAGGLMMAFGARLAGGCTSGHGISGTLQLSVGSWIAAACFFLGGITTASLLYTT